MDPRGIQGVGSPDPWPPRQGIHKLCRPKGGGSGGGGGGGGGGDVVCMLVIFCNSQLLAPPPPPFQNLVSAPTPCQEPPLPSLVYIHLNFTFEMRSILFYTL